MSELRFIDSSRAKRHKHLAERQHCGERRQSSEVDHWHSCKVFVGHLTRHKCACGSVWERAGEVTAGAAVLRKSLNPPE